MKSLVLASLTFALAISPIATFAADRGNDDVARVAGRSFKTSVSCGDSTTLLSNAPKGSSVSLIVDRCSCKDAKVALNIIKDNVPKDLCSLEPGEDCLRDIPEGADVYAGVTATPGSGTCDLTVYIGP